MHISHGRTSLVAVTVAAVALCPIVSLAKDGGFRGGSAHPAGSGGSGAGNHPGGSGPSASTAHSAFTGVNTAHTGTSTIGMSKTGVAGVSSGLHTGVSGNNSFHNSINATRTPTFTSHTPTFTNQTSTFSHQGPITGSVGTAGSAKVGSTFHSNTGIQTGTLNHTGPVFTAPIHTGQIHTGQIHTGQIHNGQFHTGQIQTGQIHNGTGAAMHFNSGLHNSAALHSGFAHSGIYHQALIGNHPVQLAYSGYHPSYMYHNFYHGPWSGNAYGWNWGWGPGFGLGLGLGIGIGSGWGYGGYYPYGYWGRPLGWGFGGWGLGTLCYNSGYYPYYNPYYGAYANQPVVIYNYSNPIPVAAQPDPATVAAIDTPPDQPLPQADNPDFDAARDAFAQGNYDAALASDDAAITRVPSDAVLHEFRGLVLFAMQDFQQAAAVVHSVLAVGPGWDWTTMSALYADPNVYTQQLRALEDYTLANPRAADAHFLLAYHYMICNHNDAAASQLQQTVRLMPSDRLAGELLKMVQGPKGGSPSIQPPDANNPVAVNPVSNTPGPGPDGSTDTPQLPAVQKDLLPGTWSASREDGSKFRLTMTDDGKFTWKYAPPKQKGEEFGGTYTVDGPVLVLERQGGGGALAGTATFDGDGKFNFKMVGGPPEDKGLDFSK